MLCEKCKKNPATTHIRKWVNGVQEEWILCSQCAKEMGYNQLSFFKGGLLGSLFSGELSGKTADGALRCPCCGISFEEIAKSGEVGCAHCYEFFRTRLTPTIEKLHGKAGHLGKIPRRKQEEQKPVEKEEKIHPLTKLKEDLARAIENQEFEQAAVLRDQIKEMEGEQNGK